MSEGIQVLDEGSNVVFDSSMATAQILGRRIIQPTTPSGTITVPVADVAGGKLFAYWGGGMYTAVNTLTWAQDATITITGNVIQWQEAPGGLSLIYGRCSA